jgi:hypothetical protein
MIWGLLATLGKQKYAYYLTVTYLQLIIWPPHKTCSQPLRLDNSATFTYNVTVLKINLAMA